MVPRCDVRTYVLWHAVRVPLSITDVLLAVPAERWRDRAEEALRKAGMRARFATNVRGVSHALGDDEPVDAVLIDLDLFHPARRLRVIEQLTHASPAPAVIAWTKEGSLNEAFELGRLGVRHFRQARPEPRRVVSLVSRALRERPVLEPRLRAMVGHATQSEMMQMVRDVTLDQAIKTSRGNKTKAGALLRISRQSVTDRLLRIEEAS